jgi:hypothetical protein
MLPGIHRLPIQVLPIIETRSLDLLFVNSKASWSYDPQFSVERYARSSNVSRVLRNLWLEQYDV